MIDFERPKVDKRAIMTKERSDFGFPRAKPYLTPLPTTPFFEFSLISLSGSFLSISFFFFFFISPSGSFSSLLQTLLSAPPYHHFHHHFSGKITGKFLGTHKHLHILFFLGKNFSSFWWVLHFCLRLFLSKL